MNALLKKIIELQIMIANNIEKHTYGLIIKINKIDKISKKFLFSNKLNRNKLKLKNINISLFKPDVKKLSEGYNSIKYIPNFLELSTLLINDNNIRHDEKDIKNVIMFKLSKFI